jgi:TetR/AcrR family transcriptional regulator, tetracycline repressor protein
VVETAERVARVNGFEQVTFRHLASELKVAPMSLYRHVRDKDDLLDEVVDRLMARRWRPKQGKADWIAWTTEAAERFRDFLVGEPAALHVYLRHPVISRSAMARMEAMLDVLRSAGFDDESARRAYAAIHTYTIGFAALEASRERSSRPAAKENGGKEVLLRELAQFTTPQQFSNGLTYLLDGIAGRGKDPTARRRSQPQAS